MKEAVSWEISAGHGSKADQLSNTDQGMEVNIMTLSFIPCTRSVLYLYVHFMYLSWCMQSWCICIKWTQEDWGTKIVRASDGRSLLQNSAHSAIAKDLMHIHVYCLYLYVWRWYLTCKTLSVYGNDILRPECRQVINKEQKTIRAQRASKAVALFYF